MIFSGNILLALVFILTLTAGACKTTGPLAGRPKHIIGRTSVDPEPSVATCVQTEENPAGVAYIKGLAEWIMKKNPDTFKGPYAPNQFCYRVIPQPDINSSANVALKYISVTAGLLRLDNATDADIAAVIAHELAHITLQHTARAPVKEEMPADYDPVEGQRRIDTRAAWTKKVAESRQQLVKSSIREKIAAEIAKLTNDPKILAHFAQRVEVKNMSDWNRVAREFSKQKNIADYREDEFVEAWKDLDRISIQFDDLLGAAPLLRNYVMTGSEECLANQDCQYRKTFRTILIYSEKIIKTSVAKTVSITLLPQDDPNQYAPYAQWKEQQADEVGFELYLRAGLAHSRYTSFVEQMMKNNGSLEKCKSLVQDQKVTPNRLTTDFMDVHPDFCFRYNNITVSEMTTHSHVYSELKASAVIETIPGLEGQLAKAVAETH
jgi:hypothetical protein